ncbi:hypothetical protein AGMMS50229_00290 [Campylobacterota bacterium]|nr:hypothetical protein AGMMS50229_00290 [Campylobacterota bacterium]
MSKKRILIFDDSDLFADMICEYLSSLGYKTARAINGLDGVKQTYSFMPHLIITDLEMPIVKGYQAIRLLKYKKSTSKIPIIVLTNLAEEKDRFWGKEAGADLYIEKSPSSFEQLSIAVANLLEQSSPIDFRAIEREAQNINEQSLIETINNLLDNQLLQMTLIGRLSALAKKMKNIAMLIGELAELLRYICEVDIVSFILKQPDKRERIFIANHGRFTGAIIDDFKAMSIADFNAFFVGIDQNIIDSVIIHDPSNNNQPLQSYFKLPLENNGKPFALVSIASTKNDYFSLKTTENLTIFLNAASTFIHNALLMGEINRINSRTRQVLARYVPEAVMNEMLTENAPVTSGETRQIATMFCDIRNFTHISENQNANDLVCFLNEYLRVMGNKIIAESGSIDKFIGDGIMAFFGAPINLLNASENAIRAAIAMVGELGKISTPFLGDHQLNIGIGINFGECVVGNIGFNERVAYTVIGDSVNVASRLEGLSKFYRHPIIVSAAVQEAVGDRFIFRELDSVRVKGRDQSVAVYAVYAAFCEDSEGGEGGESGAPSKLTISHALLDAYSKALQLFRLREFALCKQYLLQALAIDPQDHITMLYLDRTASFIAAPPDEHWDGTIVMTDK